MNRLLIILVVAVSTSVAVQLPYDCNCKEECGRNPLQTCQSCKVGWYGPYCQKKNVALNRAASANGTAFNNERCSHGYWRIKPRFSVQLGDNGVNQIRYMKIYIHREKPFFLWRRWSVEILIDGKQCKRLIDHTNNIIEDVTCRETLTGHNLTIEGGASPLACIVRVFVCSDGWFGEDCDKRCKCHHSDDVCDKVTGSCQLGCQAGYKGDDCQTSCRDGRYGQNCSEECSHCADSQSCDKTNGHCPSCEEGWDGKKCDACRDGRYGQGCSEECGHCANIYTCDKTTGHCPSCAAGWGGTKCDVCSDGLFGEDCAKQCKCHHSDDVCDKVTGRCKRGCQFGYMGADCQTLCRDGRYGQDCSKECGHCANNQACYKTDGHCPGSSVVITAVVTVLVVLLSVAGILLYLFRQQRLQWVKKSTKKPAQAPRESVEMGASERPADHSAHARSSCHVESNYAALDTALLATDENNYEAIQQNVYQNT